MAANYTMMLDDSSLPPLPSYTLTLQPPVLPPIPDKLLTVLLLPIAYWGFSLFFHLLDTFDLFPQYRLHTPAEVLKRNRVSRWDVVKDVVIQQVLQAIVGWLLGFTEPDDMIGRENHDVAIWARRIRLAERAIPGLLSLVGVNASQLGKNLGGGHPILAGIIRGGYYPPLQAIPNLSSSLTTNMPVFAPWEISTAKAIYWVLVPVIQFAVGIVVVDTWQYFLHRAMHMNKYLYNKIHSRHHRLYVPYAFGALYNHPVEGFLLDTLGGAIAYKIAGMNTRQGMCFFTGATFKTVDDHCGYALPWDPLQHLTSNNAGYHDVHHQSWGIKTNFSQPFFTFWDRVLGTTWTGGDVSARYERSKLAAQKAFDADSAKTITGSIADKSQTEQPAPYQDELRNAEDVRKLSVLQRQPLPPTGKAELQAAGSRQQIIDDEQAGGTTVLEEESREEKDAQAFVRQRPRKRTTSSLSTRESIKGLSQRMTGNTCIGGLST